MASGCPNDTVDDPAPTRGRFVVFVVLLGVPDIVSDLVPGLNATTSACSALPVVHRRSDTGTNARAPRESHRIRTLDALLCRESTADVRGG